MKNIVVIVSQHPSRQVSETLRMTVGLTLHDDNKVTLLLTDDGVYTALGTDSSVLSNIELDKHFDMFPMVGVDILAHAGSVNKRRITPDKFGVKIVDDNEAEKIVTDADIVFQ